MRSRIIKIGNSQGLRLPKPILEQAGIEEDVDIEIDAGQIIIRPVKETRKGWDEAFQAMRDQGDDALVVGDGGISHSWDDEEWQW
ncbi:MAG: AbrB/MazE/SpoVT family DNA-binding domain-containing protein [Thermodesulfobacteriota bacterium]